MAALAVLFFLIFSIATAQLDEETFVIAFPIRRSRSTKFYRINEPKLRKRDGSTLTQILQNGELLYYANSRFLICSMSNKLVTIGTPPQQLSLQIDTGSSDIWTHVSSSALCQSPEKPCARSGTYNNATSSSYRYVNSNFLIQYGDNTGAQGDYCKETLGIGGSYVKGVQIALGLSATSTEGVFGIGYPSNQAISIFVGGGAYPSLLENMVSQKLTKGHAYSLYLDDLNTSTGSIVFGGVDTAKYTGDLLTLPILPSDGNIYTAFAVAMTSISVTKPGSDSPKSLASSSFPVSVILDSGSSWNSLPTPILKSLASELGATYSKQLEGYVLKNCDLQYQSGTINFSFGSAVIKVPFDEMIVHVQDENGQPVTYKDGKPVCQIGSLASDSDFVLGDTFLRSAYVVYDLDNNQIGIAQTKFNTTDSSIIAFDSTQAGIPNALAASNVPTITSSANVSDTRPSSAVGDSATITVDASGDKSMAVSPEIPSLQIVLVVLVTVFSTTRFILM